jgi:hypothetical protein
MKKKNNTIWIVAIIALVIFLLARSKGGLKGAFLSNKQIATMYRELVSSPSRITEEIDGKNVPWQNVLAGYTKDYPGVKAAYLELYNRNLTTDLLDWFYPYELSEYVAELLKNDGQVMTP